MLLLPLTLPLIYLKLKKIKGPKTHSLFTFHFHSQYKGNPFKIYVRHAVRHAVRHTVRHAVRHTVRHAVRHALKCASTERRGR